MTAWRVVIVDDEPAARERLADLCAEVEGLEVVGAHEDVAAARDAIGRHGADLVFLDVQMPGGDGFQLLEALGAEETPVVVFVTAHADYAVRAFDSRATDYLLKPFDGERFREAVRRAVAELERRREGSITERLGALLEQNGGRREPPPLVVRTPGRVSFLRLEEIEWLDAAGNSVRIYTGGAVHRVRETMSGLERQLAGACFARIHRSTIVNLERVREVLISTHGDYTVVTDSGRRLTVGRLYRERVQALVSGRPARDAAAAAAPERRR